MRSPVAPGPHTRRTDTRRTDTRGPRAGGRDPRRPGQLTSPALLALLVAAGMGGAPPACDDPPLQDTPPAADAGSGPGDVAVVDDATADGEATDAPHPDATGATDTAADDATASDGANQGDGSGAADAGWQMIDVPKPDVPDLPLEVISTTPKDGEDNVGQLVVIEIVFSADLLDASVAEYTVFVRGPGGVPIEGELATSGNKMTFKAKGKVAPASRVTVELSTLVQSDKGDPLAAPFSFRFYTAGYPDSKAMAALAARHAPVLLQAIGQGSGGLDLLRAPDFDMDWDGTNNMASLSKFDALARVGWAVSWTHSHFFIHYAMYWPRRVASTPDLSFDNDVAGATVVVARYPKETPVALLSWFKHQYDEQMWAWATKEGGLLPAGASPKSANLRAVMPLAALFAPTPFKDDTFGCQGLKGCVPRRYLGLLTAGSHQSCLWSDVGDKVFNQCRTDAQAKMQMKLIRYRPGLAATKASGAGVAVGQEPPTFIYELVPIFEHWFPHREEVGAGQMFAGPLSWVYKPPAGRPKGPATAMATRFVSKGQADFGRPPWAWQWKPGTFVSYYAMPLGTPFFDPAWALYQRLGGKAAGVTAWDAATNKGLDVAYCFNAFLGVDERGSSGCKGALPAP